MAGNSFIAKGWGVTLNTAILAFSIKSSEPFLALIALLPLALFWLLDAYYLALERKFRDLYIAAVPLYVANQHASFSMSPGSIKPWFLISLLFRPAVVLVHAPMALLSIMVYMILRTCCRRRAIRCS
jgi:hypothetical protein